MNLRTLKNFVENDFEQFYNKFMNESESVSNEDLAKYKFLSFLTFGLRKREFYKGLIPVTSEEEICDQINYDLQLEVIQGKEYSGGEYKIYQRTYLNDFDTFNLYLKMFEEYLDIDLNYLNDWFKDYEELINYIEELQYEINNPSIILNQMNKIDINNLQFIESIKQCLKGKINFKMSKEDFIINIRKDNDEIYLETSFKILELWKGHNK